MATLYQARPHAFPHATSPMFDPCFAPPPAEVPKALQPPSETSMKRFMDEWWKEGDRERVVRFMMQQTAPDVLINDYTFELAQKVKDYLANPGAFASAAPAAGGDAAAGGAAKAAAVEEEEEEAEMDFDLFD